MRVHFLPYSYSNPYQQALEKALGSIGVEVVRCQKPIELRSVTGNDVVHLHWIRAAPQNARGFLRWLNYTRRILHAQRRAPSVLTAHNVLPHESVFAAADRIFTKMICRRADRVIFHTDAAMREYASALGFKLPNARFKIIPHGSYIDCYHNTVTREYARVELGIGSTNHVVLFLGMIRPYKGLEELIDAFRSTRTDTSRLVVAGRPHTPAIDAWVLSIVGNDPAILYKPGFVPDDRIQVYLNAADAVAFPYRNSLTSGALILAMSFGKAVIAPRLPTILETAGETAGVLYSPEDPTALAGALTWAARNREALDQSGAANLRRARKLSWDLIGQATRTAYDEAVSAFSGRARR